MRDTVRSGVKYRCQRTDSDESATRANNTYMTI